MAAIALSSAWLSADDVPLACSGGVISWSSQRTSLPTAMPGDAHTPAIVFGSSGLPGRRRRGTGAGDLRARRLLFDFAVRLAQQFARDRFNRLRRLRADTQQFDRRAFARAEAEQSDDAFDRRLAAFEAHFHFGVEAARRFAGAGRRPRMQAARMGERHVAAGFIGEIGVAAGGVRFCAVFGAQHEQRPFARLQHAAPRPLDDFERVAVRHRDHRDEARRMSRDEIRVEFDQRLARAHGRALLDLRRKAFAPQLDRIDADMHAGFPRLAPCAA